MTHARTPPLIVGIPCDLKIIGDLPFHAVGEKYINAVRDLAGALPLLIPVTGRPLDIAQILDAVDGIFLPGSPSNVAPELYGGPPARATNAADPQRDALTLPLIRAVAARGMPLLAVCRGMQEMNVAFGGTLHQFVHELPGRHNHLNGHLENPAASPERRYEPAHDITVLAQTNLARIIGAARFKVNSVHNQGIDRLAEGLVVEAVASDGTIEAVSIDGAPGFALGVQWHPEWRAAENPAYHAIFLAFGDAVTAWSRNKNNSFLPR
ncbi:MAG: gamma-glutamyl-gamma-aminobutyrate hydrolase family protein [Alphaproteobacteria bacterium]